MCNYKKLSRIRRIGPVWRKRHGRPARKVCLKLGTSCPNRDGSLGLGGCIFCAEGDARAAPDPALQLAEGLARLPAQTAVIAYLQDHSATQMPAADLDRVLESVGAQPQVVAVHLGTRPDCLPPPILEILARHGERVEVMVELGLQTTNEATLEFIGRQHDLACFDRAVTDLQRAGLRVCAHVVLGLPTMDAGGNIGVEQVDDAVATARHLGQVGIDAVKLHNCHVLRGTQLARLFEQGLYTPPELDGYLERLVPFLEHLPASVELHRLVGEARPPALVAPEFTAHKSRTLQQIDAELERLTVQQGSRSQPRA